MVMVTMIFSTKKLITRQCLRLEPLNLDGMLVLTGRLMAKVKVTVTSSPKQAYNSAMLGASTSKRGRDVSSDQKMTRGQRSWPRSARPLDWHLC